MLLLVLTQCKLIGRERFYSLVTDYITLSSLRRPILYVLLHFCLTPTRAIRQFVSDFYSRSRALAMRGIHPTTIFPFRSFAFSCDVTVVLWTVFANKICQFKVDGQLNGWPCVYFVRCSLNICIYMYNVQYAMACWIKLTKLTFDEVLLLHIPAKIKQSHTVSQRKRISSVSIVSIGINHIYNVQL